MTKAALNLGNAQSEEMHRDRSWEELSKIQGNFNQFLCYKYKIKILSDKHVDSVCEFVNLMQIRTLRVRYPRMHLVAT